MDLLAHGRGVGYLLTEPVSRPAELGTAIRRVDDGGSVRRASLVERASATRRVDDPLERLSEARAHGVLAMIADGLSNRGIATRLLLTIARWRPMCAASSPCWPPPHAAPSGG